MTTALYLTWVHDPATTMAIHWHTSVADLDDSVYLKQSATSWEHITGTHQALASGFLTVHTAELKELEPDTLYTFRVGSDPLERTFLTAPADLSHPIRFIIGGDAYAVPDLFRTLNQTIVQHDPLFAVIGGDLAYAVTPSPFRTTATEVRKWHLFLHDWMHTMITPSNRCIPLLFAPGNHDASPTLYDIFPLSPQPLYHALNFGSYLSLLLLDTGHFSPVAGPQTAWLETALGQHTEYPYLIPVYHVGAYSSITKYSPDVRTYWSPLFEAFRIPYAFEHHAHAYKRTYPLRGGYPDPTGVTYLGDGCWGANPRRTHNYPYLAAHSSQVNFFLVTLDPSESTITPFTLNNIQIEDPIPLPPRQ